MTDPTSTGSSATSTPSRGAGVVMVLLTLAGWSSIPLFLKHFSHLIDAWTANGWRYGVSALLWLPVLVLGQSRRTLPPGLWRAAIVPSLFNVAAQIGFALAPYYVDPGLMTFSMRLQIVFVMGGAAMFFPAERRVIRTRGFILGIALVIVGTAGTIYFNPKGLGTGTTTGVALSIGAGLLYAGYALAVRMFMFGMPPLVAFAAISQYTAVSLVALMLVMAPNFGADALHIGGEQFFWLVLSAVIGIGLGHTLYFASIARLGLAVSAGVVQLQPVIVAIVSIPLFGESFSAGQWACGLTAIAGAACMLAAQGRLHKKMPKEPEIVMEAVED